MTNDHWLNHCLHHGCAKLAILAIRAMHARFIPGVFSFIGICKCRGELAALGIACLGVCRSIRLRRSAGYEGAPHLYVFNAGAFAEAGVGGIGNIEHMSEMFYLCNFNIRLAGNYTAVSRSSISQGSAAFHIESFKNRQARQAVWE